MKRTIAFLLIIIQAAFLNSCSYNNESNIVKIAYSSNKPYYDSIEACVNAWAEVYRPQSREYEHIAMLHKTQQNGRSVYYTGETLRGMKAISVLGQEICRNNVAVQFMMLYYAKENENIIGFIHTHTEPPFPLEESFSDEDALVLTLFKKIDYIFLVPYKPDDPIKNMTRQEIKVR